MIDPLVQSLIGRQLGRYRIEAFISVGGMGVVFRGVHVDLRRPVAIKVVKPGVTIDESLLRRLTAEARIAATLHHPGIAAVHDIGEESGYHYMVMDYVAGSDLGSLIEREGRLDISRALQLVEAIGSTLQYAHDLGIVHRDIKPSNILLAPDGHPVLTDFGIAKAASGSRLTAAGAMLGTPEYMAPEQAQGRPTDGRSDLYALGVVFYEMITGRLPFEGDTPIATALKHITEHPVPATRWLPSLPKLAQEFLEKALAKDPAGRFQSGQEMAQAAATLRHSLRGAAGALERAGSRPPLKRASPVPQQPVAGGATAPGGVRQSAGPTVLIEGLAPSPRKAPQDSARPQLSPAVLAGGLSGGLVLLMLIVALLKSATPAGPGPPSGEVAPGRVAEVLYGVLEIDSTPPGAQILIRGEVVGTTPATIELVPGGYEVGVRLDGYKPESRSKILAAGDRERVSFALEAEAQASAPSTPTSRTMSDVTIRGRPAPVRFYIDGRYVGAGETVTVQLANGVYSITAKKEGFKDAEAVLLLPPGEARTEELVLTPVPTPTRKPRALGTPGARPISSPPAPIPIDRASPTPKGVPADEIFADFGNLRRNAERHPDGILLQLVALKTVVRKGEALEFQVRLSNTTAAEQQVSFPTGKVFDLHILNAVGDEIYRWSEGRGFPVRRHIRSWKPKTSMETRVLWMPPGALPPGRYWVYAVMEADARVETVLEFRVRGQ